MAKGVQSIQVGARHNEKHEARPKKHFLAPREGTLEHVLRGKWRGKLSQQQRVGNQGQEASDHNGPYREDPSPGAEGRLENRVK